MTQEVYFITFPPKKIFLKKNHFGCMKCGLNNLAILVDAKVKHSFEVELFDFLPSHIGGCHEVVMYGE
jgi:hypothetical protein